MKLLSKKVSLQKSFTRPQNKTWPCGAMDSALDFGSSGCGFESHQGRSPPWRNWIAHRTSNPGVAGSNPAGGGLFLVLPCKKLSGQKERDIPAGIRTQNPLIRSQMPYPLGHRDLCLLVVTLAVLTGYFFTGQKKKVAKGGFDPPTFGL